MEYRLKDSQRLVDVCLMGTGDEERLFEVADLNGVGITDDVAVGTVVVTPDADVAYSNIAVVLTRSVPASGGFVKLEGLDYWAIGVDFVIN